MRTSLTVFAVTVLLGIPFVQGSHCATYSTSTTDLDAGRVIVEIGSLVVTDDFHYMFVESADDDWLAFIGFYQESNGLAGLQRHDAFVDDTCHGMIEADIYYV